MDTLSLEVVLQLCNHLQFKDYLVLRSVNKPLYSALGIYDFHDACQVLPFAKKKEDVEAALELLRKLGRQIIYSSLMDELMQWFCKSVHLPAITLMLDTFGCEGRQWPDWIVCTKNVQVIKTFLNHDKVDLSDYKSGRWKALIISCSLEILDLFLSDERVKYADGIYSILEFLYVGRQLTAFKLVLEKVPITQSTVSAIEMILGDPGVPENFSEVILNFINSKLESEPILLPLANRLWSTNMNGVEKLLLNPFYQPDFYECLRQSIQGGKYNAVKALLDDVRFDPRPHSESLLDLVFECYGEYYYFDYCAVRKAAMQHPRIDLTFNENQLLCLAVDRFNVLLVQLLLEQPSVDPMARDGYPLIKAFQSYDIQPLTINVLLGDDRVNPQILSDIDQDKLARVYHHLIDNQFKYRNSLEDVQHLKKLLDKVQVGRRGYYEYALSLARQGDSIEIQNFLQNQIEMIDAQN